jgi:hypothetical protein
MKNTINSEKSIEIKYIYLNNMRKILNPLFLPWISLSKQKNISSYCPFNYAKDAVSKCEAGARSVMNSKNVNFT